MFVFCALVRDSAASRGSLYGTFSQLVSPELGLLQQTVSCCDGGDRRHGLAHRPHRRRDPGLPGSEWLRGFGNVQMIVFALLVILFARYLARACGARRARGSAREPA